MEEWHGAEWRVVEMGGAKVIDKAALFGIVVDIWKSNGGVHGSGGIGNLHVDGVLSFGP